MLKAFLDGWKRWLDFEGRSNRLEYWSFSIGTVLIGLGTGYVAAFLAGFFGASFQVVNDVVRYAFFAIVFIPSISISIRRLHDLNLSGWFFAINVASLAFLSIPTFFMGKGPELAASPLFWTFAILGLACSLVYLHFLLKKGVGYDNQYGHYSKAGGVHH